MIKIYKDEQSGYWVAECTTLHILSAEADIEDAIKVLCTTLQGFLIECNKRGKLEAVLDDQK